MSNNICKLDHRENQMFSILPEGQAYSEGRHKCAGCAYDQGYADGLAGYEPHFRPEEIDFSQAGVVRHKSALASYNMGYTDGMRARP
jgi:hypothetical protein